MTSAPPTSAPNDAAPAPAEVPGAGRTSGASRRTELRAIAIAVPAAVLLFIIFAWTQGATPGDLWLTLTQGVFGNSTFIQQTLVRSVPLVLAALAVVIPARAGLVNVGGEGQLVFGAVAATGIGVAVGGLVPGPLVWAACILAGAVAGGLWAAMCGALRVWFKAPEPVTTVLANFIAISVMLYLLYQPWRDPQGTGQPQSRPLDSTALLPMIPGSRVSVAIFAVVMLVVLTWWLLSRTTWGFLLRVTGGNPEAARRSGLPAGRLSIGAIAAGGALAGIGGALNLIGLEGQLRPDITGGLGFVAFLAAFLARGSVLKATVLAVLFAAIVAAGNPLQLRAGLDGSAVYVLLGCLCLAMAVISHRRKA